MIILLLSLTACGSYEIDNENYSVSYKSYSTTKTSASPSLGSEKTAKTKSTENTDLTVEGTTELSNLKTKATEKDSGKPVNYSAVVEVAISEITSAPQTTVSLETQTEKPLPLGDDEIAYITDYGKKYHRKECGYLYKSATPIKVSEAKEKGYSSCSKCAS